MRFTFDYTKARSGQLDAISKILDNARRGVDFTPIILPTGYGKSDVIRLSSIGLAALGLSPVSVIVSPNTGLRDQIINRDKMLEMVKRYSLETSVEVKYSKLDKVLTGMPFNGDIMLSATVQLLTQPWTLQVLGQWLESIVYRTKLLPVLHIDETHLLSKDNVWGSLAIVWRRHGGMVNLYTATPERHDNIQIPGIPTKTVDVEEVQFIKVKEGATPETIHISVYEAMKQQVMLDLDYVKEFGVHVPFRTAWNEDIICHIQHIPFDVDLTKFDRKGQEEVTRLSDMSEGWVRKNLGKLIRDSSVIMAGARLLVDELAVKQRMVKDCAAIVFCGNDTDDDKDTNAHAKAIEKAIRRLNPALDVVIATSATGNLDTEDEVKGNDLIKRFAGSKETPGKGDVLIVKQMASVGLDIPRLKVTLDLSPTRTPASFVQRLNRATRPYKGLYVSTYISLADCIAKALFHRFVESEQGDTTRLANSTLISEYEKPRDEKREPPTFLTDGTTIGDLSDSKGQTHDSDYYPLTQDFFATFPAVIEKYTHNDLAAYFVKTGFASEAHEKWDAYGGNSGFAVEDMRAKCNAKVKEITNGLVTYDRNNPDLWVSTSRDLWVKAKQRCGLSAKISLDDIRDLEALKRLYHMLGVMEREAAR